jgi:hypothetical protein
VQGFLLPGAASATFDENVMIEFNIDTNADAVEYLVIQVIPRDGKMYIFWPYPAGSMSLSSTIDVTAVNRGVVDTTPYRQNAIGSASSGISFFAGPRDDPFYFDFGQFSAILSGNATRL